MQILYANQVWIGAGAGAALLVLFLYLLLSAKLAIRQLGSKATTRRELDDAIAGLSQELDRLRSEISEMKKEPEPVEIAPKGLALNLNTRGHILRLHRGGESITDIANTLRLTKGEVALIVRVHDMSRDVSNDSSFELTDPRL